MNDLTRGKGLYNLGYQDIGADAAGEQYNLGHEDAGAGAAGEQYKIGYQEGHRHGHPTAGKSPAPAPLQIVQPSSMDTATSSNLSSVSHRGGNSVGAGGGPALLQLEDDVDPLANTTV